MNLPTVPTDSLHKFLTVGGLLIIGLSVVLPLRAQWSHQLRRNALDGEYGEYQLRNDELIREIERLLKDGQEYHLRGTASLNEAKKAIKEMRQDLVQHREVMRAYKQEQFLQLTKAATRAIE